MAGAAPRRMATRAVTTCRARAVRAMPRPPARTWSAWAAPRARKPASAPAARPVGNPAPALAAESTASNTCEDAGLRRRLFFEGDATGLPGQRRAVAVPEAAAVGQGQRIQALDQVGGGLVRTDVAVPAQHVGGHASRMQ